MTLLLARSLRFLFPATLLLIVAGLALARRVPFSPVLLNLHARDTRQGQVSLWDSGSGRLVSALRYNQPGEQPNWALPIFSPEGWMAYTRGQTSRVTIGVRDSLHGHPVEFVSDVPDGTENIRLTWLPSGRGLLVNYTRDYRGLGLDALIGRQLLDLSGGADHAMLRDWPYLCGELVSSADALMLRCPAQNRMLHGRTPPPDAFYVFSTGQWLTEEPASIRDLFPLTDLASPNWTYSPWSGLAFFGTFFDGAPGGLNRIPPGSTVPVRLPLELTRQPTLRWSPDGSRLLVQQADSRMWSVFDLAQNREAARLEGEDIDVGIGYLWAADSEHVAYVTLASGPNPEMLHVRAVDWDEDTTLSLTDSSIYFASIQP